MLRKESGGVSETMTWIDITQTIVAMLLAIVPGIAYPYLRDYANQKKRELQEGKDGRIH